MKKVFLSVVIPFYNSIETAKESVNSVVKEIENLYADRNLAKSFLLEDTVSEIICCNDGSTDGTANFLDGISYKDFGSGKSDFIQIKVMHLKNSGAASARNAGLRVCRSQSRVHQRGDYAAGRDVAKVTERHGHRCRDLADNVKGQQNGDRLQKSLHITQRTARLELVVGIFGADPHSAAL